MPRDIVLRDEMDALLAAAASKIEAARHAVRPNLDELALAADDLTRAAAIAGALRYIADTRPFVPSEWVPS